MESPNSRERSRSPLILNYDEDNDDTDRFDKSCFDSKMDDEMESPLSRIRDRGEKKSYKKESPSCKVYVSNLPFSFKWQAVKDLMKNKVGMVDFVETFEDENHRPRGCAVVQFRNKELAQLALETTFENLGRTLRIYSDEEASSRRDFHFLFHPTSEKKQNILERIHTRESRPVPKRRGTFPENEETYGLSIPFVQSLNIIEPLINRVFVANIDFKSSEDDLEKVFQMAGPLKLVKLSKDGDGKSKGFAIVEYEHPLHAVQAISMFHSQKYFDRELCVRMDRDFGPKKTPQQSSNLPPGLLGLGAGLGQNGSAIIDIGPINCTKGGGNGPSSSQGFPMSMGNNFNDMGRSMNNFNPLGSMNNSVGRNSMGSDGFNNFGQGQRNFNNPMQASQNRMDNFENSNIQKGGMLNFGNSSRNGMGVGGNMGGDLNRGSGTMSGGNGISNSGPPRFEGKTGTMGRFNASGGQSRFETQLQSDSGFSDSGPSRFEGRSRTGGGSYNDASRDSNSRFEGKEKSGGACFNSPNVVHISNLPSDYTWQNLRDLCHDYGDVRFAEITGQGVGLVRFGSHGSATTAVDLLDQQRFDGKSIKARLL